MIQAKAVQLNKERIFWILAVVLFALFMTYAYLVNAAILNAVGRQNAEDKLSTLSSQNGQLEMTYITLENNLSLAYAYSLGYQDVDAPQFIARASGTDLSYNSLH